MDREMLNVLLLTIDCLRFDHLGCYGYQRGTSPNIDRLASRGTLFLEAISSGGNTPTAFPSILASALPPLDESEFRTVIQKHTALAELFHKARYRTAAFHSNPWLSRLFNYNKGFDIFEDNLRRVKALRAQMRIVAMTQRIKLIPTSETFLGFLRKIYRWIFYVLLPTLRGQDTVAAEEINQRAVSWLGSHNGNFFLWLHYMDVHAPCVPPQKYARQFHGHRVSRYEMSRLFQKVSSKSTQLSPSEIEKLKDLYDAEIKYVDDAIGWLLDKAGSRLENTIVIVTADHGDAFGEHGKFFHGTSLYEEILRVPLIIAGPGIEAGAVVRQQVSLLDLAPTIVGLLGLGKVHTFHGESLLPLIDEIRRFKEEAINQLSQFEQAKIEEATTLEKERVRKKLNKLPKL